MKRIAILGSTGSIGHSTLDVVSRFPERFKIVALAAGSNADLLAKQVRRFRPELVALADASHRDALESQCRGLNVKIACGAEGLVQVASHPDVDLVVSAIVGSAGLVPTLAAIRNGKDVALANKETMVMAGALISAEARRNKVRLLPVDSEHNAIFQVMQGQRREHVRKMILTASGGPFLQKSRKDLESATLEDALQHPNWKMGAKVTLDSATLMNKGLEVIEARWLFDIPVSQIEVVIHPQSIIHSMVEFTDGSIVAQMGQPDMRIPIAYSLSYPDRLDLPFPSLRLSQVGRLTFEEPDIEKFACLGYAFEALKEGGVMPAVLNAANEVAVQAFLDREIRFLDISEVVFRTLRKVREESPLTTFNGGEGERGRASDDLEAVDPLSDILQSDHRAREIAMRVVCSEMRPPEVVVHS